MKIRYLAPLLTVSLTMILFGCDLQNPQENKQPDVEISEEKIPSYEIDSPAAGIGSKEAEIEFPDVEVPDVAVPDVDIPNTDSENQQIISQERSEVFSVHFEHSLMSLQGQVLHRATTRLTVE